MFYKDFNSNKLYKSEDNKIMSLYLLHILTFINSTIRLLGKCEKIDTIEYNKMLQKYYFFVIFKTNKLFCGII